jgi:hypothetical protein
MAVDLYTRIVFTVIAACLVLITAQGFGLGGARSASEEPNRYQLTAIPGQGLLLRVDQTTGETWTMNIRGGLSGWRLVLEEPRLGQEPKLGEEPK